MANTTLPGVLLKGVAASRPAANAVAAGTIYSATDTGAVTQSDGVSTWSTFLTVTAATRASLGLDTTDSPQFAGVNLGHASDTTLARVSAGVVSIEGTNIVKAGAVTGSGLTMATARLLGRSTASTGAIEEVTVSTGLDLTAGVLTATGGGGGGSGALVFLEAHTASSSATLDFTTFISSTYDTYKVIGTDIAPATNGAALWCRVGTGGGPTYDSGSNYESGWVGSTNAGTGTTFGTTGGAAGVLINNIANNAAYGFGSFEYVFHNLQSTAHRKLAIGTAAWTSNAPALLFGSGGFQWVTNGTAVTALQFLMSSGNIASGIIRIYGIAKS